MSELHLNAKSWPFAEARTLLKRFEKSAPEKGYCLFETGYGPSGLPHIGTFGEVARTTMVRHAFEQLSDIPTKLIAFSDDMDGLRKVPDNVPNQAMLAEYLGKPLTAVPDPFETHKSFAHHNNARLRSFLDEFGFDYEFKSATESYRNGEFDEVLKLMLARYDAIINVILPTLGDERRATYSPFLPVCPKSGNVLQVAVTGHDVEAGTISYEDEEGEAMTVPVTGGNCKMQWKADWAMRWAALEVDYEMYGKDLTPSAQLSGKITRILGKNPPEGFPYELFLDDKGEKISKSKGNGLSIEEWLTYAPAESLSLYMYNSPKKAKRLFFDVIPKHVDEYVTWANKYQEQEEAARIDNPAYHIHQGSVPEPKMEGLTFGLLMNLVGVANPEDSSVLWGFINRYAPDATPGTHPLLDRLAGYAITYFNDFIKPTRSFRAPTEAERAALSDLRSMIASIPGDMSAEDIQTEIFTIGKNHNYENLREWFKAQYEIFFGSEQGPRMGSFVSLYGKENFLALIDKVLAGESLAA